MFWTIVAAIVVAFLILGFIDAVGILFVIKIALWVAAIFVVGFIVIGVWSLSTTEWGIFATIAGIAVLGAPAVVKEIRVERQIRRSRARHPPHTTAPESDVPSAEESEDMEEI